MAQSQNYLYYLAIRLFSIPIANQEYQSIFAFKSICGIDLDPFVLRKPSITPFTTFWNFFQNKSGVGQV